MGFIDFTNGEVLTADQMDLVMRQGIMRFADSAARDTALSEVLAEGMMAYLDDTDEVLKYDGTSWIDISGDITGVTAGTALTGGGTSGNVTLDVDLTEVQPNVITTQGDLVIGDASGNPVRLPVGSADQVLTSDGTTVSFQDAGGGVGEWTQIVTNQSLGTGSSFQITGLSGYSDYLLVLSDVSFDNLSSRLEISDINGETNGGVIQSVQLEAQQTSNGTIQGNSISRIQLFSVYTQGQNGYASLSFQGAGSSAPAKCEWLGGSSDTANNQAEANWGNALVNKNSVSLDTITFQHQENFASGTINVFAR